MFNYQLLAGTLKNKHLLFIKTPLPSSPTLSLEEMPILGEFLSGPRAADGGVGRWGHPGQGRGVTFLGVKFNYPAGECV